ncbi:hypothetical protein SAY86_011278 [Trapa natans]|uniref:Uncharacterized protein n=1 Tax=Trapa natans TaxID=22666 RepID=A0AAN7R428_TRANT|nr:hypothetical protein SAY86_011278 [Trapa natans]
MEMQNLRLFMKNQRIIQENELLREKRLFSSTTTSLAQEQMHRMIKLLRNVEIVIYQVGPVFCGRQSPRGHNVIWGLHTALKIHNPKSYVTWILGHSEGLFAQKKLEITDVVLTTYKNQGVTPNTDAAQLAETFAEAKCPTKVVVGVPVTLNGDLKNQFVESNVGFDTL